MEPTFNTIFARDYPPGTPLSAAWRWAKDGYFVIPIPFRQKRPELAGWQKLRLKQDDLMRHFGSIPQNLGLLLGEPYGITDIDLDCPEALKIWQAFMPQTGCVFGRQTKPFSHFLCHMDPAVPSVKVSDPIDNTTLLELRCLSNDGEVGRQTVIPCSVHKDTGEPIRFEQGLDGQPANVDADVLVRAVFKTAAATVLARHYPRAGHGRHDTELALAGVLARAGWTEEDAQQFVILTYTAVLSHDRNAIPRLSKSVEDTFRKLAEDSAVTGIPKLASLIDKRAVGAALKWIGIDPEPVATIDASNWTDHLIRSDKGKILPCLANTVTALHAKEWQGVLAFNESALTVEALVRPAWDDNPEPLLAPRAWDDQDDHRAANWMQHRGIMVPRQVAGEAIQDVARLRPYHPIRDYLASLKWDGKPRIDTWLPTYLGCKISEYVHAVGARWLIGAAARVFEPGCKNDCALVLEGPQGIGKSRSLRALAEPWLTDQIEDFGSKDAKMQSRGVILVELSELANYERSDVAKVKAFMSSQEDRFRPPYGKHTITAPRECVFAGSINHMTGYLKDETGARRFWPVLCVRGDVDGIVRDRGQLWAEAVVRFRAGDSHWLDTPELNALAEAEQEARFDYDAWHERIEGYLDGRKDTSIAEILEHCIQKPLKDWTQVDKNRVARCLRKMQWDQRRVRVEGEQQRRYYPPNATSG